MSSVYQRLGDKQGHYSGKYDDLSEKEKKEIDVIAKARLREQERLRNIAKRKNVSRRARVDTILTRYFDKTSYFDIVTHRKIERSTTRQRAMSER